MLNRRSRSMGNGWSAGSSMPTPSVEHGTLRAARWLGQETGHNHGDRPQQAACSVVFVQVKIGA